MDKHNYEAFFLDYHEGRLSPVQQAEMFLFLEQNPELKEIFEEYEAIHLGRDAMFFPGKGLMKKKYSAEGIEELLSSQISADNCDQFFIAFIEGCLSDDGISKLNSFLTDNPDRQKDFELFKQTKLSEEKISFKEKTELKKSFVTIENCETYFIRSVEKDLNTEEEAHLKLFLEQNPTFKKELELFTKTILSPEQIKFPDKHYLKKKERKQVYIFVFNKRVTYYAAAAAMFLLFGLFFVFRNGSTGEQIFVYDNKHASRIEKIFPKEKEMFSVPGNFQTTVAGHGKTYNKNTPPQTTKKSKSSIHVRQQEAEKQESKSQPFLTDDMEIIMAEKEMEKSQMMEPEMIAENDQQGKKEESAGTKQFVTSSVNTDQANTDEYQTLGAFARRQIKKWIGIQKTTPCDSEDHLSIWDVVMAVKDKLQDIIGTKAVDVNRNCEDNGEKVEYIFSAGQIEISRKTKSKM